MKKKFLIVTTIPLSLGFFRGQVQVLKKEFNVEFVSSSGVNLETICNDGKVIGYPVEMKREISIIKDIVSLYKLTILFFKLKPYVIHSSTPKAGLLSNMAAWLNNVPVRIYYVHGLRYEGVVGLKRKLLVLMECLSCYFATDVYSVSIGIRDLLKSDGITKKKIKVIGNGSVNGIDVEYFSRHNPDVPNLKEKHHINSSNFVFGFVGRLVKDKGIHELVDAFVKINKNYPNTRLLLVGEFENGDPINKAIKVKIKTNKNILHVGFQRDVRPFLKMMNVFVFPSYREGFGVSLMEAAAMDVPAISSDITGCNEIIKNGYNGILIPSKSVINLFNAMEKMISDINLSNEMSKVCRTSVIDKYEQKALWDKTFESYSKLIKDV
ncbi:MAG: glycosyltransferase family 4 protein [Labilibaculum sp.]|nr:glycosyltransferase family 4 protein [Labilibaculum sp.]